MKRKAISTKTRALLQREIASSCPFCASDDVDHFQVHHIDENPTNNEINNLVLLCPLCHSKITKGDIGHNDVVARKHGLLIDARRTKLMPAKIITFRSK